jgi:hypothetical protein
MAFNLHVRVPAIRGHFGDEGLWTFQTQVQADELVNLLGHDPRQENWRRLSAGLQELYTAIQRRTSGSRRDAIEDYLEERLIEPMMPGAFPAICIGMTRPPRFEEGIPVADQGTLLMDLSPGNTRILLDGLGRVTGSLAFLERDRGRKGLFVLPATIFAPHEQHGELTLRELGQLFFDFNFRVQPLSPAHAMDLDQSDPYLILTNKLGRSAVITKHGGMETRRQSLGPRSRAIVVQALLLRFVRGACEGFRLQLSNKAMAKDPRLTREAFTGILQALQAFLDGLEHHMGPERFGDRRSVHLTPVGWQALGLAAHDLIFGLPDLTPLERDRIVKEIAGLDWTLNNRDLINIGVVTEVDGEAKLNPRHGVPGRDVTEVQQYIRTRTRLGHMLPESWTGVRIGAA